MADEVARAAIAAACLATLAACQKSAPPAPPPFNTTIPLHELMTRVIDPATDAVWAASGVVVDLQGEHDLSPRTAAAWARVRDAAAVVAESGNLLLLPGRVRPGRTWTRQARTLSALGLAAMRAAELKDRTAMLRIGGDIHDACEECHRVYVLGEAPRP
ncbi:MAG: hypothetical protein JWO83_191 [Caulobacteraceae bacterium]|nr:hypothetical protein [Caulobacteraceae bacterium]